MTAYEFAPLFLAVCAEFGLSPEARAVAWRSCFSSWERGKLSARAVRLYRQIDATRGPWRANGGFAK